MSDIHFVQLDGWCGIYIDGALDAESESFAVSDLLERFCPDVGYSSADGTSLQTHAENHGGLPTSLDDALRIAGHE